MSTSLLAVSDCQARFALTWQTESTTHSSVKEHVAMGVDLARKARVIALADSTLSRRCQAYKSLHLARPPVENRCPSISAGERWPDKNLGWPTRGYRREPF